MNEELINTIEDNIEELPDEVRDFIFGDELKSIKEDLAKQVYTDNQKLELSNTLMFFLLGGKTQKELDDFIETLPIGDERKFVIRAIIQEKVINELLLIIEASAESSVTLPVTTTPTPSSSVSLTALSDRLKQASIATPAKRDYSLEKGNAGVSVPETPSRTIDPYHEPVDNE